MGGGVPTDQEKRDFVGALVAHDLGRIVVCNVLDGHTEGHLKDDEVKQYFDWWIDLCIHQELQSVTQMLAAMGTLHNGKYPQDFKLGAPRPVFLFRCPKRPRKQRKFRELCTAVPALVLREVIDDTTLDALRSKSVHFPANHSSDWTDDFVNNMMSIPDHLRVARFGPGKSIGRNGNIWVTGKAGLDRKLVGHNELADQTRDVLGLVHRKPPDVLVAFHFPWEVTNKVPTARPTFMDAGDHRRFRVQPDAQHRRRMVAWGHTADLAKASKNARYIDGLPERVCGEIGTEALEPKGKFGFAPLGRVTTERGHGADTHGNDAAFAQRLANGRTNSQLAIALLGIIV